MTDNSDGASVASPEKTVRWDSSAWQQGFTMVPDKVLMEAPISAAALRVYILLLRYARLSDDEWPGQQGLALEARCSERTVRAALRELEDEGLIQSRRRGLGLTNVYTLMTPRDDSRTADIAVEEQTRSAVPSVLAKREEEQEVPPVVPPATSGTDRPSTVGHKRVSDIEYGQAKAVLAAFNARAETRYTSREWIAKIVARIREHPEVGYSGHVSVIERVFAEPWWEGDASPSVIYGNAGIFERSLHALRREPSRERNVTADEIRRMGDLPPVAPARELGSG